MLVSLGDIEGLELKCPYRGLKPPEVMRPGFLSNLKSYMPFKAWFPVVGGLQRIVQILLPLEV